MNYLESIKILDGKLYRIELHNRRCNNTRRDKYGVNDDISLTQYIHLPQGLSKGLLKCRVLYHREVLKVSYQRYTPRIIKTLKLVSHPDISYNNKAEDRPQLDRLYAEKASCDEIIISRNGLLTDAYYYNIALYDGMQWVTPRVPLLEGVMREELLQNGVIIAKDINESELYQYSKICLFNALNEFGDIELSMSSVQNI